MSIFNSDLEPEVIASVLKDVENEIYFIGILGSGMYPLARMLAERGYRISGSDAKVDREYSEGGIAVKRQGSTLNAGISAVVYSLAVAEDNPEILCARSRGIPLISRAQLLGALMSTYTTRIAVSGSHGKSTVTAMIDSILFAASVPHTSVSGAKLSCGEPYVDMGGEIFLAEACEYKDSFLRLSPTHQLITSVELDHTDYFESLDQLRASFLTAALRSDIAFINCDDPVARGIAEEVKQKGLLICTYGKSASANYRLTDISHEGELTRFSVITPDGPIRLTTSLMGDFNLYNATAAVAVSDNLGIDKDGIRSGIADFRTVERRMNLVTVIDGIPVYYDYAHHPSEIRAVISAAKERYGTVTVVFRPHTYSRTKSLWNEFISEFSKSDFTIMLDIYPAREERIIGIDSVTLAKCIPGCVYAKMSEAAHLALSRPTGAILLLGAGEIDAPLNDLIEIGKSTGYIPERR